jgi:Bacterial protein of unknown function (Gcw_chp)
MRNVAPAETPVHSFTGEAALHSEDEYRGISQTSEKPAAQLNLHRKDRLIGFVPCSF